MRMYPMCAYPPLQFVLSRGRIMQWVLETITQLCKVWWCTLYAYCVLNVYCTGPALAS